MDLSSGGNAGLVKLKTKHVNASTRIHKYDLYDITQKDKYNACICSTSIYCFSSEYSGFRNILCSLYKFFSLL